MTQKKMAKMCKTFWLDSVFCDLQRCKTTQPCHSISLSLSKKTSNFLRFIISALEHVRWIVWRFLDKKKFSAGHLMSWLQTTAEFYCVISSACHYVCFSTHTDKSTINEEQYFSHSGGGSVSREDELERQLEQFKNSEWEEGRRMTQFAFTTLLLTMHEAWYQAPSANSSNVSQWHLGNWLGKLFDAIKKLKDF